MEGPEWLTKMIVITSHIPHHGTVIEPYISHIYTININPPACLLANRNIFISLSLTFNILSGISFLTEKVSGKFLPMGPREAVKKNQRKDKMQKV